MKNEGEHVVQKQLINIIKTHPINCIYIKKDCILSENLWITYYIISLFDSKIRIIILFLFIQC